MNVNISSNGYGLFLGTLNDALSFIAKDEKLNSWVYARPTNHFRDGIKAREMFTDKELEQTVIADGEGNLFWVGGEQEIALERTTKLTDKAQKAYTEGVVEGLHFYGEDTDTNKADWTHPYDKYYSKYYHYPEEYLYFGWTPKMMGLRWAHHVHRHYLPREGK